MDLLQKKSQEKGESTLYNTNTDEAAPATLLMIKQIQPQQQPRQP